MHFSCLAKLCLTCGIFVTFIIKGKKVIPHIWDACIIRWSDQCPSTTVHSRQFYFEVGLSLRSILVQTNPTLSLLRPQTILQGGRYTHRRFNCVLICIGCMCTQTFRESFHNPFSLWKLFFIFYWAHPMMLLMSDYILSHILRC